MPRNAPRFSLQSILALDAAICAGTGLLLAVASGPIARLTAVPGSLIFGAALLLLPTAVLMAILARHATVPGRAVHLIVAGNLLWVFGSVFLPVAGLIAPNALGWLFLLMQAALVTLFAGLEWAGRPQSAVIACQRRFP